MARVLWLAALCVGLAAGCASDRTTVTVLVRSDSVHALRSLDVSAHVVGAAGYDQTVMQPLSGGGLKLPGRIVVELPPEAISVTITIDGVDDTGAPFATGGQVVVAQHRDVTLRLDIGGPIVDGDGGVDLMPQPTYGAPGDDAAPPTDAAPPADAAPPGDMSGCGVCAAPKVCCGNACVDLSSDPNHCGSCSTVCTSGLCGSAVTASMSALPPHWSFNTAQGASTGSFYDATNHVAVVTSDQVGSVGSILYQEPIVTDSFTASFDFRAVHAASPYGDGMGFVLIKQNTAVARIDTAVGITGGGLGMMAPTANGSSTILTGYGVELDSFDNDTASGMCGETVNGDHVNVDTLAQCFISSGSVPSPLATPQAYTFGDGNWHTATLTMTSGKLSVAITTNGTKTTLFNNVTLTGFNAGDLDFLGFTGSCGGLSERQELRNVSITFPTPRCL